GTKQGSEGKTPREKMKEMRESCSDRHGVAVNKIEFMNGYRLGLQKFCSYGKGQQMGQRGRKFEPPAVCTEKLIPVMRAGYEKGLAGYCRVDRFEAEGKGGAYFDYSPLCPADAESNAKALYKKGLALHCRDKFVELGKRGEPFLTTSLCDQLNSKAKLQQYYGTGNKIYCTKDIGYEVGLAGKAYKSVCKKPSETDFLIGYNMGAQKKAQNDIRELSNELHSLRQENAEKDLQIQTLSSRVNSLEREVYELEEQVEEKQEELEDLKNGQGRRL
ncbi:MAG: DUF2799 domain-containing protein, partial [Pseudomonadota bacterium]